MNVVFHIGYQKTASTWLQNDVFPNIPLITFLNNDPKGREMLYENILKESSFNYDYKHVKTLFDGIINEHSSMPQKTLLMSEEVMTGDLLEPTIFSPKDILDRLIELDKALKIVIIVRNQSSLIWSSYKEYLKLGGCCNIEGFLYKEQSSKFLEQLHYGNLIKHYINSFGRENVFIGCYEDLVAKPEQFLLNMINFISSASFANICECGLDDSCFGKRRNVGYLGKGHSLVRLLNKISKTRRNPGGLLRSINHQGRIKDFEFKLRSLFRNYGNNIGIPPEIIEYSLRYKGSNAYLQELLKDIDLINIGYSV